MPLCKVSWPGEPPEDGEMIEMTLSSKHRIRNSRPGGLRPSTLPLGNGGSPQYWLEMKGCSCHYVKSRVSLEMKGFSCHYIKSPVSLEIKGCLCHYVKFRVCSEMKGYSCHYVNTRVGPWDERMLMPLLNKVSPSTRRWPNVSLMLDQRRYV